EVTTDLSLPKQGAHGTTITWESHNESIISNEGKVTRPSYEDGDQTVKMTAKITDGVSTVT
ncbi:immunoglobulin-like domain-containing protein, partial [Halalkalibacterium halodurans]|nr:hypothetical protein [Halalkalibacterium halodurans]